MAGSASCALTQGWGELGYHLGVHAGPFLAELDLDAHTLHVSGDVEDSDVADLRSAIDTALDDETTLVVDLTSVSYLPSVAIGALVDATQSAAQRGGGLEIVARRGTVAHRVLEVCGIAHRSD